MKVLINYSDAQFRRQQRWNTLTGKLFGGFDQVIEYAPDRMDAEFRTINAEILQTPKGGGLWLWKPYIILQALSKINDGDYLFYCDSGAVFIKPIEPLIELLKSYHQDILCFNIPLIEKQWTKRETFIAMDCDSDPYINSTQIAGGYILLKKSTWSVRFMNQYLKLSTDKRLIANESVNLCTENYPEFISHRNDQSILSLLYKKNGLRTLRDISDFGFFPEAYYQGKHFLFDNASFKVRMPKTQCIVLSNRKVHPIKYTLKFIFKYGLKRFFPKVYLRILKN